MRFMKMTLKLHREYNEFVIYENINAAKKYRIIIILLLISINELILSSRIVYVIGKVKYE